MANPFQYRVFGLGVTSEIALEKLPIDTAGTVASVNISANTIDPADFEATDRGLLWSTAPSRFQIALRDVATLRVCDGHSISVDVADGACPAQRETLVLSAGFGALIQQRGMLPLHAAAFETNLGAVVLAGVSGAGKSVLLAALNKRGYPIISDDIAAIETVQNELCVMPAWPSISLMPDAIDHLQLESDARASMQGKHDLPASLFCKEPKPLARIVLLNWTPEHNISINRAQGVEALAKLTTNVYRRTFLKGMKRLEGCFKLLNRIVAQVPLYVLTRPHDLETLEPVLDQLENELGISPPDPTLSKQAVQKETHK